jgi:NitT/TauT family transport system substrate-binding protein
MACPYFENSVGTINGGMLVTRESIEKNPDKVLELVKAPPSINRHKHKMMSKKCMRSYS